MVNDTVSSVKTLEDLQNYVYESICADNDLLSDAFHKSKRLLRQSNGEICGVMFCVHGPRTVDFSAIWERRKNRIFFYNPMGERYRLTVLDGAPIVDGPGCEKLVNESEKSDA